MFFRMLYRYEITSRLDDNIVELGVGLEENDTLKMKEGAHKIKGSSGYVGAARLHYATYYIHNCWEINHDDYDGMVKFYPGVVEAAIEFKKYSRWFIAKHEGI